MSQKIATIPAEQSPKLKCALDWLAAARKSDVEALGAQLDDDYEHFFHPQSIGKDTHSKADWLSHITPMLDMFRDVEIVLYDIIEGKDKVVLDFKYLSKYYTNSQLDHEVVVIMGFTGDASSPKIRTMKEFSDSASYANYFPKLEEHKAKIGA